ncbi:MAG: hypothetical protein GYA24_05155, partial [Candidatus Lokiarchaeota archaeon]|nr:hypothetical protein [Candidatus Lokiarchaeota archaeon]
MSKARTPIASQRDLLHFIANPPPALVPRAIPAELIRISGKPPATSNTTIEKAIEAITTGKNIAFTFPVATIPVTTRATISSRVLEGALKTCKRASQEITLEFSPRGLRFATIDGDHTMMCRVTIAPEAFTEFDPGNMTNTIRVDLKAFVRALARAGRAKGRDIQLRVGTGGAAMSVAFRMDRGTRNTIAFAPVPVEPFAGQNNSTDLFAMDLKVPPCSLAIDRVHFLDALRDARLCCHVLQARVEGNLLHLTSTGVEEGYNTAIPLASIQGVLEGGLDMGTFSTRDLAQVATALRA